MPYTVRYGAKNACIIEGMATLGEELACEVYNDPFYTLFAAFRRNMTVVRMKGDLMVLYEGRPLSEVSKLYQEKAGMSKSFADGYALAHVSMPGYMNCYYIGYKHIRSLLDKSDKSIGSFIGDVFGAGGISLDKLDKYMSLSDEDKKTFTFDFCK